MGTSHAVSVKLPWTDAPMQGQLHHLADEVNVFAELFMPGRAPGA
jgi:hypothetical protein